MVPGLELSPEELAGHFALRGAPVDEITSPGAGLQDIVIGKVVAAGKHPNADRLSVCTVDGGEGEVQVVCGAPNVRAGAHYPFAPVGAVLPGDFKIKKAKIRGETSQGMLCSAKELGLGADHTGILEIEGDFVPGESFIEALGLEDSTLDVEITANRGDLLSHVGLARELASEGSGEVVLAEIPGTEPPILEYLESSHQVSVGDVSIQIDDPELCPRYLGAVIRGVTVGPSPTWLQERLRGTGARPINNVVDATNYVMLELGQPLHAFDLQKLSGSGIVVRCASSEEVDFVTLDDQKRRLTPDTLMICDRASPVAIAGVMGGMDSEVEDETVDILLECALFDPKSIRATRRGLSMSTDASYRFERGVDPEGMRAAIERCVQVITGTAGGRVDGPVLDCHPVAFEAQVVPLRLSRVEHLLGIPFTSELVRRLLAPLGFKVESEAEGILQVRIPGFRSYDVTREVDLIEEVARTYGYDAFPSTLGPFRPGTVPDDPMFQLEDELRSALAARGLFEAQTPAFVPEGEGDLEVSNPLATTEPFVRRALLPSLLRRVEYNFARGNRDVRLFEIGTSFQKAGSGQPPVEATHLAVVLTGRRDPPHWAHDDVALDLWDLKSVLEDVARRAYRGAAVVAPSEVQGGGVDPRVAFEVTDAVGKTVGFGGLVLEASIDVPVWAGPVWGLELTLPRTVGERPVVTHVPLPQYPSSDRDLALLVPHGVTAATVSDTIRGSGGKMLGEVRIFDLYEGEAVDFGTRSVAFRLRFRASERTLKDTEVDKAVQSVLRKLEEELGVKARG